LVPVLSFILTKMVERNDKMPLCNFKRTVFHAEKAPLISLPRYLERVMSFAPCSNSCFIIALIYIDRIIQNHTEFVLNSLSVHRMLITSVMLATKFFDDETFNNLYYARVGGLQITELNVLEEKFLSLIDFSLTIHADVFERYRCELSKHAKVSFCSKTTTPCVAKASQEPRPSEYSRSTCQKLNRISCAPVPPCTTSRLSKSSSTPASSQAPSLVRSVCEALVVESTKDKDKALQSRLIGRISELLTEEEKCHKKVPPSSVKTLCATLVAENDLSPTLISRAASQAERLERLEKMESIWYQSGCDYTAREPFSDPPKTLYNAESANTLDLGSMSINNKGIVFSQCTPAYPNNSRQHMVAVTWG